MSLAELVCPICETKLIVSEDIAHKCRLSCPNDEATEMVMADFGGDAA